jgi:hypothetical protein
MKVRTTKRSEKSIDLRPQNSLLHKSVEEREKAKSPKK